MNPTNCTSTTRPQSVCIHTATVEIRDVSPIESAELANFWAVALPIWAALTLVIVVLVHALNRAVARIQESA